jgi:hypothetical protein
MGCDVAGDYLMLATLEKKIPQEKLRRSQTKIVSCNSASLNRRSEKVVIHPIIVSEICVPGLVKAWVLPRAAFLIRARGSFLMRSRMARQASTR